MFEKPDTKPDTTPAFLLRAQPPAQFALCDDGRLLITVGEVTQTLMPEDIRRLDRFMNLFAAGLDGQQPAQPGVPK